MICRIVNVFATRNWLCMNQNQTGGFNDCLAGRGNGSGQTFPVEIDRKAAATMSV